MATAEGFLRDVLDAPDDDVPRLVFADWLDDRGDHARAEFVRVQCALAKLSEDDGRLPRLAAREGQLLRRHGKGWAGPLRRLVKRWKFRRGFVEAVTVRAADFLRHGDAIFGAAPVREVRWVGATGLVGDLARSTHLPRLTGIDLRHEDVTAEQLGTLLGSARLTGLKSLGLRGTRLCTAEGFRFLAAHPKLAGLAELDLSDYRRSPGDRGYFDPALTEAVRPFAESPHLGNLSSLCLAGYRYRLGRAYAVLAESPLMAHLERLDLSGNSLYGGGGTVTLLGLLTGSRRCAGLRVLRLRRVGLGRTKAFVDLRPLVAQSTLANLRVLDLRGCSLDDEQATALARSDFLAQLTELDLGRTLIGGAGLRALSNADGLPNLTSLSLDQCYFTAADVRALADAPLLGRLRSLSLQGVVPPAVARPWPDRGDHEWRIGPAVARCLAESPRSADLRALDLGNQSIGDAGLKALADSPHLAGLTELRVWHNDVSAAGAKALLASKTLRGLGRLDLRANPIPSPARRALRERFGPDVRYGPGPVPDARRQFEGWTEEDFEDHEDE